MNDLRAKMEAELNSISAKQNSVLNNSFLSDQEALQKVSELQSKRDALRHLIQSYINIQNRFTELMGAYSINY